MGFFVGFCFVFLRACVFIYLYISEKASSSQPWIDGTDKADEGVWRFSDGTLMPYSHWEASQPNHDGDCVRLRLRSKKVKWWDTDCSLKHGYICEIPVA